MGTKIRGTINSSIRWNSMILINFHYNFPRWIGLGTGHIQPTPWIARGKNNMDRFLRTGFQTTNNLSLSASGENYNLRFSLSHSYQQSIIPNNELNITNFNMYGSYNRHQDSRLKRT